MNDKQKLNELALNAQNGDTVATERLLREIRPLCHNLANRYYVDSYSYDDLIQEQLVVIWEAIEDYDSTRGDFLNLAYTTAERRILLLLKRSANNKEYAHSSAISADAELKHDEDDGATISAILADDDNSRNDIANEERETLKATLEQILPRLTDIERISMLMTVNGYDYETVAQTATTKLGHDCDRKQVDNALQRARGKIRRMSENDEISQPEYL